MLVPLSSVSVTRSDRTSPEMTVTREPTPSTGRSLDEGGRTSVYVGKRGPRGTGISSPERPEYGAGRAVANTREVVGGPLAQAGFRTRLESRIATQRGGVSRPPVGVKSGS